MDDPDIAELTHRLLRAAKDYRAAVEPVAMRARWPARPATWAPGPVRRPGPRRRRGAVRRGRRGRTAPVRTRRRVTVDARQAKRMACTSTALLIDAMMRTDRDWTATGPDGARLGPADERRHRRALHELADELLPRGAGPPPTR